jgi:drug/metabolite transporter (DMT)-like permease
MEFWIIFSLTSSFLFAIVSVIDKYGVFDSTNLSPKFLNMYVGFSNAIVGAIVLLFFGVTDFFSSITLLALTVGMIQGLSLIILFWSLKNNDVTRVMPIWSAYPIWVLLIALTLTNEVLTFSQLLCILLLISGSIIANIKIDKSSPLKFSIKSFIILIFGTLLFGLSQVINKEVVQNIPVIEAFGFRGIGVCLTLAIPFSKRDNLVFLAKYVSNWKKSKYIFTAETFLATFAYLTILYSLVNGPVSLVAAISGTRPVFIVVIYTVLGILRVNISESFSKNEVVVKIISAIFVSMGVFGIAFF